MKSKEEVVQEYRIQSIQEATMRVIARKGMAAATMQEIADEAGVAKGTIYLYFRDRDEQTFESAMAELSVQIDEALDQDIPFEEKLRTILRAQVAFFGANREFFRLYLSLRNPDGGGERQRRQKSACHPQYQLRVQKLAGVLGQAMERGEIKRVDPNRLALFMIEGTTSVIVQRLTDPETPDTEADVELMAGLILDGIRKRS